MVDTFRIQQEGVTIGQEGSKLSFPLSEFYESMPPRNFGTGVLPPEVKICNDHYWVCEIKPRIASVLWGTYESFNVTTRKYTKPNHQYKLSFPYVWFVLSWWSEGDMIGYTNMSPTVHCFFSPQPLTSLSNKIYYPAIPNADGSTLCISRILKDIKSVNSRSAAWRIVNDDFWSSEFNDAYDTQVAWSHEKASGFHKYSHIPSMSSAKNWAQQTAENPAFIFDIPWDSVEAYRSLGGFLSSLKSRREKFMFSRENALLFRRMQNATNI